MHRCCLVALAIAGAGCTAGDAFQYAWDDRRELCSLPADDVTTRTTWDELDEQLVYARDHATAAILHAHVPDVTISTAHLTRLLDRAAALGLDFVTFADLTPESPARPALALSLDDDSVSAWFSVRDLLRERGVRASLFVTRFHTLTPAELDELAMLAGDGHAIEAHGVDHLDAPDTIAARGLAAYLADEALPSIDVLVAAGYTPTAFAYPFGRSNDDATDALLGSVDRVRVGPGSCPY